MDVRIRKKICRPGVLRKCQRCDDTCDRTHCSLCKQEIFNGNCVKINGEIRTTKNNWIIRCFDCANPPCIMKPQCKTCPTCRDPSCNNKKCKQPIESLPFKLRPKSLTDVQDFICQGCAIIRCDICDLEKPKDSFSKSAIYDTKKKKKKTMYWLFKSTMCTARVQDMYSMSRSPLQY